MPFYDLRCSACSHEFTTRASISARSSGEITCPACGGRQLEGVFKSVTIILNRNKGCDSCEGPAVPSHRCGGGCGCGHSH